MKRIAIPGWGTIEPTDLVIDLNGTLTESGELIPGATDCLKALKAGGWKIHVLSGDTRGNVGNLLAPVPGVEVVVTKTAREKRAFVEKIGPESTVCVGNGNIDVEMFKAARLSICAIQAEGATIQAVVEADIVVTHIKHAFEILLDPQKLIATLRR